MTTATNPDAFERGKRAFLQGLAALDAGRLDDAHACFVASLADVPGRVSTLVNLAAVRLAQGHADGALDATAQVLALEPHNAEGWFHRGHALAMLGRHADALPAWEQAAACGAPAGPVWLRHGQTLQALDRAGAALASYGRALAADPTLAQAWTNRGSILREQHRAGEAADAFRQALAHGGDAELHAYYLAALGADAPPATAPPHYVETLFDDYAAQFDAHLVGTLHYDAHGVLTAPIPSLPGAPFRSALDLGCGTGLCGPRVRPHVKQLDGVDLSAGMLAQARATGVYDRLAHADIVAHLAATPHRHDLVLAADVFIYIGDLAPVFAGVRRVIDAGGCFCFSAELAGSDRHDFRLLDSLRYAHAERYLRALAARHGFAVHRVDHAPIREDQRVAVPGIFMHLVAGAGGA